MNTATNATVHEGTLELAPREGDQDKTQHLSVPTATPTPADLLALAMSQGADLDQLERLMALQERWEANHAEKAFITAMTAFKAEPVEILKRKRVFFQTRTGTTEYNHAELSDVVDAAIVGMAKHGLSHAWETEQMETGRVQVTCVITHAQGHSKRTFLRADPDNSGSKNPIQAVGSVVTYLQRYTLLSALGLATKGMDDDGRGGKASDQPTPQANSPEAEGERDAVVQSLYAAADHGKASLLTAWGSLPEKDRSRVGLQFKDIRAHAEQVGP